MKWLPWNYGALIGVVLLVVAQLSRSRPQRHWQLLRSFATEASIVAFLYSLWALAGRISLLQVDGAIERGEWLWNLERQLRLPNEKSWQEAMRPHSLWTQSSNLYYFIAHVPAMGIFLVWLFARSPLRFPIWRNTLALLTGSCLLIQLIPVAPPRLIDSLEVIDTGLEYGQSVYGTLGYTLAGQLQAMPSIHVAWAALIGWATWREGTSAWRWTGPAHWLATMYVVVVTGNHYWLDGLVAVALLVAAYPIAAQISKFTKALSASTLRKLDHASL